VTVTCTNTTPYNVVERRAGDRCDRDHPEDDRSRHRAAGILMSGDDGRTISWGNTIGTDTEIGTGNGTAQASPCLAV
jgi:hypothetical protein